MVFVGCLADIIVKNIVAFPERKSNKTFYFLAEYGILLLLLTPTPVIPLTGVRPIRKARYLLAEE